MSLRGFISLRDLHSTHWLTHDMPDETAWEDRVGLKIDFMAIQWGLIKPLEDAYRAQELLTPWWSDPEPEIAPTALSPSPSPPSSAPSSPLFAPRSHAKVGPAPPPPTAAPSATTSNLGVDYDHSYSDAEIKALISGWSVPANAGWSKSANEALIREMIKAVCGPDAHTGTRTELFGLLRDRLEDRHGVVKKDGAVRSHWMRHLRAVCGVDERVKANPESLRTSLNPAQQRKEGLEKAKMAAEKAKKEAELEAEKAAAKTESKKRKRGAAVLEGEDEDERLARKLLREDMGMRKRR
ncbi:hypothetical protein BU16DRAFT_543231 [Lophium mytilinum]|uniref:Uncharacterized protein n=1 Tax=Lophium mytilinum TaxID=390894 RepID=A0A6A6QHM1_9PEZI|nr:hypothetical protein BU16DRAFT_543231 [Lophium mytilinum]